MRRSPWLFLATGLAAFATAKPMAPSNVPTERLLANAIANVRAHPEDPYAHYAVGRIRYAIYCASDPQTLRMYSEKPPYRFTNAYPASWEFQNLKPKDDPKTIKLVQNAIFNLRSAIQLDKHPKSGLTQLTLACLYEASAPIAAKISAKATPESWLIEAARHYGLAFQQSASGDIHEGYAAMPVSYAKWISVEAGESVLRLQPDSPLKKAIRDHLAKVASLPPGPISPIVFSLDSARPLDELLDGRHVVDFDLNGTGEAQRWTWVKPDTGVLVWQPDPSVPITSGRQLFGSATWWMMYPDGYAAMAALDNDRNGWLEGKELFGLAVWRDRNGNARSEPGETVPVTALGIAGLRVTFDGRSGRSLVSSDGVRLKDGRTLPSYDWVTSPIRSLGRWGRSGTPLPFRMPRADMGEGQG